MIFRLFGHLLRNSDPPGTRTASPGSVSPGRLWTLRRQTAFGASFGCRCLGISKQMAKNRASRCSPLARPRTTRGRRLEFQPPPTRRRRTRAPRPGTWARRPPRPTVHRAQATPSALRSRDPAPRTQKKRPPSRHQADESGRSQAPKAPREATWRRYSAVAVSTSTEPSLSVAGPGRPAPTKASRAPRASRSFSARFALATAIISLMRLS